MEKTREEIQAEIDKLDHKIQVLTHREQRLLNREKYRRKLKDRRRTHRLIQYGVVMESHHKELEVMRDEEIYSLMENIVSHPPVQEDIVQALAQHNKSIEVNPEENI